MAAEAAQREAEWVRLCNNASGKEYFWRQGTDETAWGLPREAERRVKSGELHVETRRVPGGEDGPAWQKVRDASGREYWWDVSSDETAWTLPRAEHMHTGVRVIPGIDGLMDLTEGTAKPKATAAAGGGRWRRGGAAPSLSPENAGGKSLRGKFFGGGNGSGGNGSGGGKSGKGRGDTDDKSSSGKGSATLERQIKRRVKDSRGKADVESVIKGLDIGAPFNVEHKVHVRFDKKNVRLSGLPTDWSQAQFGVALHECPRLEVDGYAERIPAVLELLRRVLEENSGFAADGLFRLAPDKLRCDAVKEQLNRGRGADALAGADVHVTANLIKQWFRELEPNLLNFLTRDELVPFAELAEDLDKVGPKVAELREPQQSVLLWLLDLLARVAKDRDVNRMTPKNLAIVFSPNLYDISECSPMEGLVIAQKLAGLLENLILWRIRDGPDIGFHATSTTTTTN